MMIIIAQRKTKCRVQEKAHKWITVCMKTDAHIEREQELYRGEEAEKMY